MDQHAPKYRIVTTEQLNHGWIELCGRHAVRRDYHVLANRGDGTFVVAQPELNRDGSPLATRDEPSRLTEPELNVLTNLLQRIEAPDGLAR